MSQQPVPSGRQAESRFRFSFPGFISTKVVGLVAGVILMIAATPVQSTAQGVAANQGAATGQAVAGAQGAAQAVANPNAAPFPPLSAAEQQQLDITLNKWEEQSKGTKTLTCQFQRWHYDLFEAPAGIHAEKASGFIKYSAPDRGEFKVEEKLSFNGMQAGKPQFAKVPGQFGEHWVCTGEDLMEFDYAKKECKVQQLPPGMRGQAIFDSPLPFVFNLDAKQIKERYWVRQVQAPKPGIMLIEAYPKRQVDRSQYKLVQIALGEQSFLPEALLMYAPNFNVKTAPKWDHYEFVDIKRNTITQGFALFRNGFIQVKPPADWKVFRNAYHPPGPQQITERPMARPLSDKR